MWPAEAVVEYLPTFALILSNGERRMLRNCGSGDAYQLAANMVDQGEACVRVARAVGKYGRTNLFQDVAVLSDGKHGDLDDGEAPSDRDWFAWRKSHDTEFAKAHHRNLTLKTIKQFRNETIVQGYGHTNDIDRDGEIVAADAFAESLPRYLAQNPVMLFNHNPNRPIGSVIDASIDDKGTKIEGRVVDKEIRFLLDEEVLRTFSVSFIPGAVKMLDPPGPNKPPIPNILSGEMLENSVVSIPSQRNATLTVRKAIANGIETACRACRNFASMCECECEHETGEVEFRAYPAADRKAGLAWEPARIQRRYGKSAVRDCAAWDLGWQTKGSDYGLLAFPHHGDGSGAVEVYPLAVAANMGRLLAYQGEVADNMTEEARALAYGHLAAHFEAMGAEIPQLEKGPAPENAWQPLEAAGYLLSAAVVRNATPEAVDAYLAFVAEKGEPAIQRIEVERSRAATGAEATTIAHELGFATSDTEPIDTGDRWCLTLFDDGQCQTESFSSVTVDNGVTLFLCSRESAPTDGSSPTMLSTTAIIEALESSTEDEKITLARLLKQGTEETSEPENKPEQGNTAADTPKAEPSTEQADGDAEGEDDAHEIEVDSSLLIAMETVIEAAGNGAPINPNAVHEADRMMAEALGVRLPEGNPADESQSPH
jgi:hypothetical protein